MWIVSPFENVEEALTVDRKPDVAGGFEMHHDARFGIIPTNEMAERIHGNGARRARG